MSLDSIKVADDITGQPLPGETHDVATEEINDKHYQKVIIVDGDGDNVTDDANDALNVSIASGGTTQYQEITVQTPITGTAMLAEVKASNIVIVPACDANGRLDVDVKNHPDAVFEDSPHVDQAGGYIAMAVRNDGPIEKNDNDNDYSTISVDSYGRVGITSMGNTVTVEQAQYALQYDDAGSGVEYVGEATAGTATSAATWRIKRITTTSGDIAIEWADGDTDFDNIWDNRAALSYS